MDFPGAATNNLVCIHSFVRIVAVKVHAMSALLTNYAIFLRFSVSGSDERDFYLTALSSFGRHEMRLTRPLATQEQPAAV